MKKKLDPVTTEIIRNQLHSIVDEIAIALMKSAYSTNIKERRDHSAAVFDADGKTIAQVEHLPLHLGSMLGLVKKIKEKFPVDHIYPGDIFISNDPYRGGGSHLPDVAMAAPIFHKERLVMFVGNIAHHADIGGASPGSMAGGMTEIYQEGLRIPPIKIYEKGNRLEDIFDLILTNVRVPKERTGDYLAHFASLKLGVRRIKDLYDKWGEDVLKEGMAAILDASERHLRAGIAAIPDGEYSFEDYLEDDGLGNTNISIRVRVLVDGDKITFDFTGSAPQVPGNINISWSGIQATVAYTLKCLTEPNIPSNDGFYRPIHIIAPEGTIVNASFPAASAGRAQACQRVVDVIIGALSQAIPERAVAAANGANTTAVFYGKNPKNNDYYVYLETYGGGFGGRAHKDGKDGVQVHITNTSNLPVEALESEYPLHIENYCFIPDSGGAGEYRGGLGLRRDVRVLGHTSTFSAQGERFILQPWGLFGGKPGAVGKLVLNPGTPKEKNLPSKASNIEISNNDIISIQTPGAGGYGDPKKRSPQLVIKDIKEGKISLQDARQDYGLNI